MLIGSYCTMEYAIESSALFNPSIVEDFDQSDLEIGENESSYPSVPLGRSYLIHYFRRAILDKNNDLHVMKIGENIEKPKIRKTLFNKERIVTKLAEMSSSNEYAIELMKDLPRCLNILRLKIR
jgi:hypothetical protein